MPTRFMTDPHEMRSMAGRFDVHAQTVEDEARKMWASSQNIAGASWSGTAQATSYDTMGQMNTAFRNIVNMLHGAKSRPRSRSCPASPYPSNPLGEQSCRSVTSSATWMPTAR
jgi:WXG100 family type VII secretion target